MGVYSGVVLSLCPRVDTEIGGSVCPWTDGEDKELK